MQGNNFNSTVNKRKATKYTVLGIVLLVFLALMFFVCKFYGDIVEIKEIGDNFLSVYIKNLETRGIIFFCGFLVALFIVFVQLFIVKRNLKKLEIESVFSGNNVAVNIVIVMFSVVFSFIMSGNSYSQYLAMKNNVQFFIDDPLFGYDISYFVFLRPFIKAALSYVTFVFVFSVIFIVFAYLVSYIKIGERTVIDLIKNKRIATHLFFSFLCFIFINSIWNYISAQDVLLDSFAGLTGAGFVLSKIKLNFMKALPLIAVVLIVLLVVFYKRKKNKILLSMLVLYFVLIIGVDIVGGIVQLLYVSPNESKVEEKYIADNIKYTRIGYGIDKVVESDYEINNVIDINQANQAKSTIENIRIIGLDETLSATNQVQSLRNYYRFNDLDIGLYNINGKKQAVAVGVRELEKSDIDTSAQNYINEKFRYTHGYGAVMSSINSVTAQGEPDYYIKDISQEEQSGVVKVTQPRIYFGELADDNVVVNSKIKEIDYSEGTKDYEFSYDGKAGIELNFINRCIFALKYGDIKMLVSNQITPKSKLLTNRNIIKRVKKIAPFIKIDGDPQSVIDDNGKIVWVIDGYTTTNKFPYSQYTDGYNYIRNSVKITVDAYDGTVKFYITDYSDPIVNSYGIMYPGLFEKESFPLSLSSKVMFPEYLFTVQCKMYAQYHNTSPVVFYNKSDMYSIANEKYDSEIKSMVPYYNLVNLKEFATDAQFIGMIPYTLNNRENMVSWIAVGNEGANYGKLVCYKFPKSYNIYGPLQIENIIDNDSEISKELTLWNSGDTKVLRGNLLVIPIFKGILYIEPVYLTGNNQASLPCLKRVIAVFGDNVSMKPTVEEALVDVLNKDLISSDYVYEEIEEIPEENETEISENADGGEYTSQLSEAYNKLEENAKNGNWEEFGKALNELKEIISKMQEKNS